MHQKTIEYCERCGGASLLVVGPSMDSKGRPVFHTPTPKICLCSACGVDVWNALKDMGIPDGIQSFGSWDNLCEATEGFVSKWGYCEKHGVLLRAIPGDTKSPPTCNGCTRELLGIE
jgi:hypothetical protein